MLQSSTCLLRLRLRQRVSTNEHVSHDVLTYTKQRPTRFRIDKLKILRRLHGRIVVEAPRRVGDDAFCIDGVDAAGVRLRGGGSGSDSVLFPFGLTALGRRHAGAVLHPTGNEEQTETAAGETTRRAHVTYSTRRADEQASIPRSDLTPMTGKPICVRRTTGGEAARVGAVQSVGGRPMRRRKADRRLAR